MRGGFNRSPLFHILVKHRKIPCTKYIFLLFLYVSFYWLATCRSTSKRVWTNWRICLSSISECAIRWILRRRQCRPQAIATTTTTITAAAASIITIVQAQAHPPLALQPPQIAHPQIRIATAAVARVVRIRQVRAVRRAVWKWHQPSNQILRLPQNHSQVPRRMFKMSRFSHFTKTTVDQFRLRKVESK